MTIAKMGKKYILDVLKSNPLAYNAIETDVHYLYFSYPQEYTHYLRITLKGCTVEHTHKLVCIALLDLEKQQPHTSVSSAITYILAGMAHGLSIINDGHAVIETEPVPHIIYDECSGIHILEMTNPDLKEGQWSAQVEIHSSGSIIFSDAPCWAIVK